MKLLLKILIGLYLVVCILAYLLQDKIILRPHTVYEEEIYTKGVEVEVPISEELTMNCVHIRSSNPSKGVVLYFHGNKGNNFRAIYQTRMIQNMGYDVFIPDYRGYGKTEGKIWSDKQLLADADEAYKHLMQYYEEKDIYLMGYSLGSGMASYVASKHNPAHLFMVAPFTSLVDIKNKYAWFLPDFLMRLRLPVRDHMRHVACPVSIVHGTEDTVVDYAYSEELKQLFPQVNLITSKGQTHRGIIFDKVLVRELGNVFK